MSAFLRIGTWAANSFKYFHPDIELISGTFWELGGAYNNLRADTPFKNLKARCPDTYNWHCDTLKHPHRVWNPYGISKFKIAEELIRLEKFDKIIVLGADTITCARLTHFLQDYACFNCGHTDVDVITTPDMNPRFSANPDVICFNARVEKRKGRFFRKEEGRISPALTLTIAQWEHDFKVGGREETAFGEMWSLTKVLDQDLKHTHPDYVNRLPIDNTRYSYNANKGVDVWVGKDFELINDLGTNPVRKLYVYHIQSGLGTKTSSSQIYDKLLEDTWLNPIFNSGSHNRARFEQRKENRKFFKIVTGDNDMFKLSKRH